MSKKIFLILFGLFLILFLPHFAEADCLGSCYLEQDSECLFSYLGACIVYQGEDCCWRWMAYTFGENRIGVVNCNECNNPTLIPDDVACQVEVGTGGCARGAFPALDNADGLSCSLIDYSANWIGQCTTLCKKDGVYDESENKCILCSGYTEWGILGSDVGLGNNNPCSGVINDYTYPGDYQCESACGADEACDEVSDGGNCIAGKACGTGTCTGSEPCNGCTCTAEACPDAVCGGYQGGYPEFPNWRFYNLDGGYGFPGGCGYASVENCDDYDSCYSYGTGCEERNYYCSDGSCNNYNYSNRHTDGCVGNDWYDYYCSGSSCTYSISYNDSRCVVCPDAYCGGACGDYADYPNWRFYGSPGISYWLCGCDYASVEDCDDYDSCYSYGTGCEERNYYCSDGSCNNYNYSNRHTDECISYGISGCAERNWYCSGNSCTYTDSNQNDDHCVGNNWYDYYCSGSSCTYSISYNNSRCVTEFDFSISLDPTSGSASPGYTVQSTVTANLILGTTQNVNFYVSSGSPENDSDWFEPTSCNPDCSSIWNHYVHATTLPGIYQITVCGITDDGTVTRCCSYYELTVEAGPSGDIWCADQTETQITIGYTFSNGTNVSLFRGSTRLTIFSGSSGSGNYTDTGLSPDTSYNYYLRNGTSSSSPLLDSATCSTGEEPNAPPGCDYLNASPNSGTAPLNVNFTAGGSDSDGTIVQYEFDFGDGSPKVYSGTAGATHIYNNEGSYTARLRVQDNDGAWSSTPAACTQIITVGPQETCAEACAGYDGSGCIYMDWYCDLLPVDNGVTCSYNCTYIGDGVSDCTVGRPYCYCWNECSMCVGNKTYDCGVSGCTNLHCVKDSCGAECDENSDCASNNCQADCTCEVVGCLIGGTPYDDGDYNPTNKCQVCDVSKSSTSWSNVPDNQDPASWCSPTWNSCTGSGSPYKCQRQGGDGYCDGAGACDTDDRTGNITSGYVCTGSGAQTAGSATYYSSLSGYNACTGSGSPYTCQRKRDKLACNGSGGAAGPDVGDKIYNITSGYVCTGSGAQTAGSNTYYSSLGGCNTRSADKCDKKRDKLACNGSGGTAGPDVGDDWTYVPAYKIANSSGQEVDASASDYTGTCHDCTNGECSGTYRWGECDGSGNPGPCSTYNQSETVCASVGCSLTSSCGDQCDPTIESELCDSAWRASTGSGDNYYGKGGDYSCQGMCDGLGLCEYAVNCELIDTTLPITEIKVIRTSTGEDVTAAGAWLRADTYTIQFVDTDPEPSSGWKSCEYYIYDYVVSEFVVVQAPNNRACNGSLNITTGSSPYHHEGVGAYFIYTLVIDNADLSDDALIGLNFDFTPPETWIE